MKHYGDITKLNGYTLPVVDVITGGSPCQDLSVAGKRAGLDGERSGLFMEQVRITKEMRENDRKAGRTGDMVRPRHFVWENVPGALSSPGKGHTGEDFQAVLTEIVRIAEPECPDVPLPKNGKWSKSGALFGVGADGCPFSLAWRVHDAQFWGVPQRRRRIALVADFGGLSASEILFERKGLSGDSEPCGEAREETAGAAGGGVEGAGVGVSTYPIEGNGARPSHQGPGFGDENDPSFTLNSIERHGVATAYGISSYDSNAMKSPNPHSGIYEADTARTLDLNGGSPACNQGGIAVVQPAVYENHSQDSRFRPLGDICQTVSATYGMGGNNQPLVVGGTYQTVTSTLNPGAHPGSYNGQDAYNDMLIAYAPDVAHTLHAKENCQFREDAETYVTAVDCRNLNENESISGTLQSKENGGYSLNYTNPVRTNAIVRRLTPLECERLQGYPDGWTDIGEWVDSKGKKHKDADSPRYKALGNSIALPFWQWMARRICAQYERSITMGSLFDGISGFPLVFARCGAEPLWTSEIEEFPIAVAKKHFGDEATGEEGDLWRYLSR
jgi:DNA (cytosine-5)-methyltransferase 1